MCISRLALVVLEYWQHEHTHMQPSTSCLHRFAHAIAAVVAGFIEGGTKEEKAAMKKLAEVHAPPLHQMSVPAAHCQLYTPCIWLIMVRTMCLPLVHSVSQQ